MELDSGDSRYSLKTLHSIIKTQNSVIQTSLNYVVTILWLSYGNMLLAEFPYQYITFSLNITLRWCLYRKLFVG